MKARTVRLSRRRGCVEGSQGPPSAHVHLRLRPSTFAGATDTTTGEPFNYFFLPKSSSSRSSVLSACRSIFTKQNIAVETRDGSVHFNVCTYFGMPIKLFLIRIWPRPPPSPFSSGKRILKNFENYRRPLSYSQVRLGFVNVCVL